MSLQPHIECPTVQPDEQALPPVIVISDNVNDKATMYPSTKLQLEEREKARSQALPLPLENRNMIADIALIQRGTLDSNAALVEGLSKGDENEDLFFKKLKRKMHEVAIANEQLINIMRLTSSPSFAFWGEGDNHIFLKKEELENCKQISSDPLTANNSKYEGRKENMQGRGGKGKDLETQLGRCQNDIACKGRLKQEDEEDSNHGRVFSSRVWDRTDKDIIHVAMATENSKSEEVVWAALQDVEERLDFELAQNLWVEDLLIETRKKQRIEEEDERLARQVMDQWNDEEDLLIKTERKRRIEDDERLARQLMDQWNDEDRVADEEEEREREALIKDNECYICMDHEGTDVLNCGHVVHVTCALAYIRASSTKAGGRINPNAARCGQCRQWLSHPALERYVAPLKILHENTAAMALQRMAQENPQPISFIPQHLQRRNHSKTEESHIEETDEVLREFVYYMCANCKSPYYGGRQQCMASLETVDLDVSKDRICAMCANANQTQAAYCPIDKHGTYYIEYKCRYCCNVATFFCYGTTHFCEKCHVWAGVKSVATPCPGLPQCNGQHPRNDGQEHCLGCALCRDIGTH